MKFKIIFLMGSILLSPLAHSYSPASITNAINDAVKLKLIARGFSGNDPRFYSTLSSISTKSASIASASSALRFGSVTGRSWMTAVLRGALLGRGKIIALAASGVAAWLLVDESTVQVKTLDLSREVAVRGYYWQLSTYKNSTLSGVLSDLCQKNTCVAYSIIAYERDPSRNDLRTVIFYNDLDKKNERSRSTANSFPCDPTSSKISSCQADFVPSTDQYTVKNITTQQAIDSLTQTELDSELSPAVTAEMANSLWQSASPQTYPASDPITANEIAASPSVKPVVGDLVQPDPQFTGALPAESTPTSGDSTQIGSDPKISPPELSSPTAREIFAPISGLMPFLQNYEIPIRSAQCPIYQFDWNDRVFTVDAHCILIEKFSALIKLFSSVLWSLAALRIILSA
ncbi:hypothetical protein [Dickeya dadantii]|uniref:hypothetical protein n=1 Tax=Dickeya dadantii TaxID=204038 RepID=UPI0021DB34C8|nr:hypothetical protein [Dickeya dadantii]